MTSISEGKTKIIATLGPSSGSEEIIEGLILNGVDVFRLNFSHDNYEEHRKRLIIARNIAEKLNKRIAIIQDLCGPKIRLGKILETEIKPGDEIILGDDGLPISVTGLIKDLKKDDLIFIDDGKIVLKVMSIEDSSVKCKVERGGLLSSFKGINIKSNLLSVNSLTDKDLRDLDFSIKENVDYVALSFVRTSDDVINLKKEIEKRGKRIPVIAKIEKEEALKNLEEIINVSDAIMIARGDLGIESALEEVPIAQMEIINKSRIVGKPVIVATQIMESMINNPYPTRAEVNDIATAILQGADAIMFSAETSVGKYPVEVIETVNKICLRTEKELIKRERESYFIKEHENYDIISSISYAACKLANNLMVKGIIVPTETGRTAKMISRFRPLPKIIALTTDVKIAQELCLVWGVTPMVIPIVKSVEELYVMADKLLIKEGIFSVNDEVIFTSGSYIGISGTTNNIKYHKIGNIS